MSNHLINETSPYLLQHANNPVDWYPWGEEAFLRAKKEDKPIFLSVGYSTCHWCHVMAHESFEDTQIAEVLNRYFISIKVDKEERPDVDSVYMSVCQALTGSGGWPMTIFMTPEQKPFMAGTYFPPTARYGRIGFWELILGVSQKWNTDRKTLMESANGLVKFMNENQRAKVAGDGMNSILGSKFLRVEAEYRVVSDAVQMYKRMFDKEYGGFGDAPKFPAAHNLLFLMRYYEKNKGTETTSNEEVMAMVDKTLLQMYRGGMFDHIGGGFSRYSTDRYYLVPHFEKMLYDNALLIMAYSKAYQLTSNVLYRGVAEKTAGYILREMTARDGGFFSAQDADSEGVEGKYYVFEPIEIMKVLGREVGRDFCGYFDITKAGNFEGKSIPNLLKNTHISARYNEFFPELYEYRKRRCFLHLDDKILTSWNGLMIGAMCQLYRVTGEIKYLEAAKRTQEFVEENLSDVSCGDNCEKDAGLQDGSTEDVILYVSWRNGRRGGRGYLDDYANEIFALVLLYEATLDKSYLAKADMLCRKVIEEFWDQKDGGFFLSGKENEKLFIRSKETYDGAMPSGNSMMAYNLVRLYHLVENDFEQETEGACNTKVDGTHVVEESCRFNYENWAKKQLVFLEKEASLYPTGYAFALTALMDFSEMPDKVTIVLGEEEKYGEDVTLTHGVSGQMLTRKAWLENLTCLVPLDTIVHVLESPTREYPLLSGKTTYYVCRENVCYPPSNELTF